VVLIAEYVKLFAIFQVLMDVWLNWTTVLLLHLVTFF